MTYMYVYMCTYIHTCNSNSVELHTVVLFGTFLVLG